MRTPVPDAVDGTHGEDSRVAALLAGDGAAVEEVRGWIRLASTPYRDLWRGEIEDLEQDALLVVLTGLRGGGFRGEAPLRAYVRSIVHHRCIDRLRVKQRRRLEALEELEGHELAADEEPVPDRLVRDEAVQLALRVQARMPRGCQELWDLVRAGWTYGQMADRLGTAEGALRVRVLRCRRRALALRDEIVAGRNAAPPATTESEENE